jgi:hypothetical protein
MLSLSFALCCLVAFSEQLPQSPEQKSVDKSPNGHGKKVHRPLTFDKHGFFQLSVFEDLHFGEGRGLGFLSSMQFLFRHHHQIPVFHLHRFQEQAADEA